MFHQCRSLQVGDALTEFTQEFGIPEQLTMDGAPEMVGRNTDFMKKVLKYKINYHITEPNRHRENRAESIIRKLKKKWYRVMVQKRVPKRLWDCGLQWVGEVMQ